MNPPNVIKQKSARSVVLMALIPLLLPMLPIVVLSWICFLLQSVPKGAQE